MKGKYDSFRDAALHFLCLEGWSNGEFGDVQTYGVYIWKVTNTHDEFSLANTETTSVLEQWDLYEEANGASQEFRDQLVGHFVISENDQGAVHVLKFDTVERMEGQFNAYGDHYTEWSTKNWQSED